MAVSQTELWELEDEMVTRLSAITGLVTVRPSTSLAEDYAALTQHPPGAIVQYTGMVQSGEGDPVGRPLKRRMEVTLSVGFVAEDLRVASDDSDRAGVSLHALMAEARTKLHGQVLTGSTRPLILVAEYEGPSDPDTGLRLWQQDYVTQIWVYEDA